ncbi:MAG: hypothetical protein [Chaetfec virus UA24_144]|nr:MAG: hypothetical protein [Chaetfec virus UA24_144]
MEAKRVFISQPYHNVSMKQLKQDREETVKELLLKGYKIINPELPEHISDYSWRDSVHNLGLSISLMGKADLVYFCKGWRIAPGCIVEREVARQYNIPCLFEV